MAGTTLGADNGVGVAAALAVLESGPEVSAALGPFSGLSPLGLGLLKPQQVALPPIEVLLTVDEEGLQRGCLSLCAELRPCRARREVK